jgi:hypothetical protein
MFLFAFPLDQIISMAFRSAGEDVASVLGDSSFLDAEFHAIPRIGAQHTLKLAKAVRLSYRLSFWNWV